MSSPTHETHGSLTSYTVGFVFSMVLTLLAYLLVTWHVLPTDGIITLISTLAVAQLLVQLIFFLHLDRGSRWNFSMFCLAAIVVGILVGGSLWIMHNLDYSQKTGQALTNDILSQEAIPQ